MEYFLFQRDAFLDFLKAIVEIETPSEERNAVNQLTTYLEKCFREIGVKTQILEGNPAGDHLLLTTAERAEKILLIGHMDTVWQKGTLLKMPFRIEGERAYGPGIFDMKTGIAFMFFIFKAFMDLGKEPDKQILALITSDEETGSKSALKYIEKYAKGSKAVLVLEPAGKGGSLKTSRKGLGMIKVDIQGKAAHAGLDHEAGVSAVKELANLILQAEGLTNYSKGTTVNVGVVKGGTVSNVVPANASAEVDFRFSEHAEGQKVESFFKEYSPSVQAAKVEISGGIDRGPLLRTEQVAAFFEIAKACALELGFDLSETAVGGVSDGNFTSAMGIPTLDGLGAVGDGAHSDNEYINIDETLKRLALVYNLIFKI